MDPLSESRLRRLRDRIDRELDGRPPCITGGHDATFLRDFDVGNRVWIGNPDVGDHEITIGGNAGGREITIGGSAGGRKITIGAPAVSRTAAPVS